MFGLGKATSEKDAQREREIEQQKTTVRKFLEQMVDTTPEDAERISERMKAFCQEDKLLDFTYKNKAMKRMRELECEANMRVADQLIREATRLTGKEQMRERGQKLADSRRFFSKVCSLGADSEWKKAYQRLADTVMMSGGVQREGYSRAKPLNTAPATPNRAKM